MNALALALALTLAADPSSPRVDVPQAPAEKAELTPAAVVDGLNCFSGKELVDIGKGIAATKAERDVWKTRTTLAIVIGAAAVIAVGTAGVVAGHELAKGGAR